MSQIYFIGVTLYLFRRSFRPSAGVKDCHTATGTCKSEIPEVGKIINEFVYIFYFSVVYITHLRNFSFTYACCSTYSL